MQCNLAVNKTLTFNFFTWPFNTMVRKMSGGEYVRWGNWEIVLDPYALVYMHWQALHFYFSSLLYKPYSHLRMHSTSDQLWIIKPAQVYTLFFFRLLNYMNQNSNSDALVVGVTPSENPFRDQKSCTILWKLSAQVRQLWLLPVTLIFC